MINATLCSTNGVEPWAANVNFEVQGLQWTTSLNTKYAHYKNIIINSNVVVVYKTSTFEILAKGTATLSEDASDGTATASIVITWLRLVENGTTTDHSNALEINEIIHSRT